MTMGKLHLYSGDGKGKTSAAMGLALRAMGAGKSVVIVQFLKSTPSGEIPLLEGLGATVLRGQCSDKFVFQMTEEERRQNAHLQNELLQKALNLPCDVLILDEGCAALSLSQVEESLMKSATLHRPQGREVVVTGRNPAQWLVDEADYHTEMVCHRHPYEKNCPARKGIEF